MRWRLTGLMTLSVALGCGAQAQTPPPPPASQRVIPEKPAPDNAPTGSLNGTRDRTNGVIEPAPSGDRGMAKTPPDMGRDGVIVPQGPQDSDPTAGRK